MSWNRYFRALARATIALVAALWTAGTAAGASTHGVGLDMVLQTTPAAETSSGLDAVLPYVILGVVALVIIAALVFYFRPKDPFQGPLE